MYTYYHNLNPVFLSFGQLKIYYYGLIYAITLLFFYFYLHYLFKHKFFQDSKIINIDELDEIIFFGSLSTLFFARLFYMIFYSTSFFNNPIEFFFIWRGGMSSLGGFFGLLISLIYIQKRYQLNVYKLSDSILLFLPLFLAFGRFANFINAELIGKVTSNFFLCIDYTKNQYLISNNILISSCRYPSQLFEVTKNLFLFLLLIYFNKKQKLIQHKNNSIVNEKPGKITLFFFIFYSLFRFIVEFFRIADSSYEYFGILNFNQIIYLVVFVISLIFFKNKIQKQARLSAQ